MHRLLLALLLVSGTAHAGPPPRLAHGTPVVMGKLAASAVVKIVKKSEPKLLACYKQALADPAVKYGTATASFTIEPDGKLTNVAVSSSLTRELDSCVAAVISKLAFKKPKSQVQVMYPLTFGSRPEVRIGAPTVKGGLDKKLVRRYLQRNSQDHLACYEKQLAVDAKLAGTMTAQFTIGPDGKVATATTSGLDPTVASCLELLIRRIEFPRPSTREVTVSYPMTFVPPADSKKRRRAKR